MTWVGRQLGLGDPHKLGQLLNVPAVIGTLLLVAALARLLWPERRWLAPAAVGFVALSPVLTRTASMFNPEPTDLFVSTLCLYLAARILVRRRFDVARRRSCLGLALGGGEMVRQFSLWTLAVVVLASSRARGAERPTAARSRRRSRLSSLPAPSLRCPGTSIAPCTTANPVFDRPHSTKPLWERRPARFYVDPGLPGLFRRRTGRTS